MFTIRPVPPCYPDVRLFILHLVSGRGPGPLRGQGGQQPQLHRAHQHDEEPPGHCQVSPGEASVGHHVSGCQGPKLSDCHGALS